MRKAAAGLRERRPDVMELLARARPASLDPGPGRPSAAEVAARLAAAEVGARLTIAEEPPGQHRPPHGRWSRAAGVAARPGRRVRSRDVALTGTGLAAAATAVALLVASPWAPGHRAGHHPAAPTVLTVAMVRHVASASRSALARSGRAVISSRSTQAGAAQGRGSSIVTYSGRNWNVTLYTGQLIPGHRPTTTLLEIERIVGGQLYLYTSYGPGRKRWYHDTSAAARNYAAHPGLHIPDPRTALSLLEPSARFVAAGQQQIAGIRLTVLRATRLNHLSSLPSLSSLTSTGRTVQLTSLEVWVDGHSVVHRIALTERSFILGFGSVSHGTGHGRSREVVYVPNRALLRSLRAAQAKAPPRRRQIIRLAPRGDRPAPTITTTTVTFSHIGQPQRIAVPAGRLPIYNAG